MARTPQGFVMSKKKLEAKLKNESTFAQYFNNLKNIAESTFLYEDLPETINTAYLERILFRYGMAAVFEEPEIGLVALPCVQSGGFDVYGVPLNVRAFSGYVGFSRLLRHNSFDVTKSDCVLFYNTNMDFSSAIFKGTLGAFAERLANDARTEDINIYAQRTPVAVVAPQGQVETIANTIDRYENYGKWIFGYKGFDLENIKALQTGAPLVANEINEHRTKLWNEALSFLGVSNVSIYKKERVTTDEVARSMGGAIANRNVRQGPREKAIDEINRKWGEKYNFTAKVTFNESLFDLDPVENENIIGYNREPQKEQGQDEKGGESAE